MYCANSISNETRELLYYLQLQEIQRKRNCRQNFLLKELVCSFFTVYIANQYNSCYHGYNAMISMTIIILKKPMMSSKSSPPTRWWWWRRRHGTASGRHGAIYIHSSIRYTYTALVSSFSSLLLVSNKPLYSWTLTSHWPVWLAARRRISWLRSSTPRT